MANAQKHKKTDLPRQQGELARLKVVQGPDFGSVYTITGVKAKIGRGEDNDVVILDLKASRLHAQLIFVAGTGWTIKDSGSANGIHFNGRFVRELSLRGGEVLTLGETTFEFLVSPAAGTQMLVAPVKDLATLKAEQQALADKRKQVRGLGGFSGQAQKRAPNPKTAEANRRTFLFAVGALGLMAYLYLDGSPPPPQAAQVKKTADDINRDLASWLPQNQSKEIAKSAEMFFRAGFREYRERNYLRARTEFETVLQILPGHPLATLYLENCKAAIDGEVRFHLDSGKKCLGAGKLKEAQGHFEAITRLLFKDQRNPAYVEASEQLVKLKKTIDEGGYS